MIGAREASVHSVAGLGRWPARFIVRGWACGDRFGGRGRRFMAFAALPSFLGVPRLSADRDIFVAIGNLGHDWTGRARLRLVHQTLQFRRAVGEVLAFGFQLLAVVKLVFGRIGECRTNAVAHFGAAGKAHSG